VSAYDEAQGNGRTVGIEAAEAADVQDEANGIAYERQIAWRASIV
jgi:hypothetical protein